MADIHVGDVGTELVVTVLDEDGDAVDVSAATTKTILLRKPGPAGGVLSKAAAFDATGADGRIKYTTQAGDLDTPGIWSIQGYVVLASGRWHTLTGTFRVRANLA